jgi:hypothetical protein
MSNDQPNKNTAVATNQKAILGIGKHFAKVKTVSLAGTSYTPATLKALLQAEIDANNALEGSRAQYKEEVASARTTRAKAAAARKGLRAYILGNYGAGAAQMLADFGMVPPKPMGRRSVQVKAQAATQAAATRKAHDAAKKQVATVVAPTAAQATPPAHVAPAATPAQTAAPAATNTQPQ